MGDRKAVILLSKKQIVTSGEIVQDIITSLKAPDEMSKESYKKITIPCIIVAVIFAIIELVYPKFILFALLSFIPFLVVLSIINHFKIKRKMKNIHIDDYIITTAVLSHKEHDGYVAKGPKWHSKKVNVYTLNFENGECWRIPPKNYNWSERNAMSDFGIYQSAHRGDVFIVVTKKDSAKIVMAYHTDFFEYKKSAKTCGMN